MSQQSRILAGVFCSGMAAALIAMAALQLPNWLQQRKMVSESPPVVQTAEPEQTPEPQVTAAPTVQPAVTPEPRDFTALLERNPEVIGWIKIDDTDVDLPVMQREGDNSYYLKHDLDGNWDDLGLPYLDYECDIQQSRHLILYGHNMGVGDTVRFSSLQNYREPEYYQEHPVIELDSLNGGQYYKIVAVYAITTRESDGDVFHFNQYVNFADDAAEQEYLDEVAKRAFYTTGDYARADERLLTLCTCTYEMSDARLLIMARPLRDGETLTADEVIINPDPLLPARWPAATPVEPTATPVEPTATPVEPTATPAEPTATPAEPTATPTEPTATPVVTPTTPVIPETTPTNTPANTPTEETNTPDNTPTNTPDVTKSNTPADNSSKIIPQTGVSSSNSNSVAGLAIVLVAALGGAAAYLFINRKKLN